MKKYFMLLVASVLFLLLSSVISISAQDTPAQVGLRPDAPPYALTGSYWVGTQSFVIEGQDNPGDVRVWYPALHPDGDVEPTPYPMHWSKYVYDFFDNTIVSPIPARAFENAQVDMSAAPYPVVVFSHGFGAESVIYAWLLEHIASYGFIVVAPDHKEIGEVTGYDFARTTITRAQSIPAVLDFAEELGAENGALAGALDMEHVAVSGQSYGGYTALAAAGAQYDMNAYAQRCDALAEDDPDAFLCVFAHSEEEMAEYAGLSTVPDGLWPSMGDPRVDAIVSIAGDSYMYDAAGLAKITMPVLAIGGTSDTSTPYYWGIRPTYDNISSEQKILVSFENADHFIAMTSCADSPSIADPVGLYFFCSDSVWDMDRAHDLLAHFITAFLLDELKGDADAGAALAPDAVSFPGIGYESQGF